MNTLVLTYLIYTATAVALTGVLAHTLHKHGKVFLADIFDDNATLARALNSLLVTGFYMLNLGYAFLIFRTERTLSTLEAVENLVIKLGALLVSLGVIHFINMAVFWRIRRYRDDETMVPAPFTTMVQPPPPAAPAPMAAPAPVAATPAAPQA